MKKHLILGLIIIAYIIYVISSFAFGNLSGQRAIFSLVAFTKQLIIFLPFAFILIGLFEVWIRKETIERYLGLKTGILAYLLAIGLAGTTVGGLYVAFPFAFSLYKKGAKLTVIFTYLTCAGVCRIPMTIFETSFLGLKFTIIRFVVSLPLIVLTSWLMGTYLQRRNYTLSEPDIHKKNRMENT